MNFDRFIIILPGMSRHYGGRKAGDFLYREDHKAFIYKGTEYPLDQFNAIVPKVIETNRNFVAELPFVKLLEAVALPAPPPPPPSLPVSSSPSLQVSPSPSSPPPAGPDSPAPAVSEEGSGKGSSESEAAGSPPAAEDAPASGTPDTIVITTEQENALVENGKARIAELAAQPAPAKKATTKKTTTKQAAPKPKAKDDDEGAP